MGKAERYYWLKMYDDFFGSTRIKKLRKIAGGDTYLVIYLKMQLVAMKQDGVLKWKGVEEKFADELALDLDEDPANVEVTIAYLVAQGLAEFVNDTTLFLPYAVKNVGSETNAAERMRVFRAKAAENLIEGETEGCKALGEHCSNIGEHCSTDIEIRDKRIENRDKRIERDIDIPPLPPTGGEDTKHRPNREPKPEDKFTGELLNAVNSWLDYKWERNKSTYYKETGYKSLITQLCNCARDYGDTALVQVIQSSMANNYQGICFGELKKGAKMPETLYDTQSKAYRAAKYFADQKLADCPDRSQPTETDLQRWANALNELHSLNSVSWKVMAEVMDYSLDSEWWSRKIQSAYDFKTNFNRIFADMSKEQGAVKE